MYQTGLEELELEGCAINEIVETMMVRIRIVILFILNYIYPLTGFYLLQKYTFIS